MAILHATIPDDLQRQLQAVAKTRGVPMRLLAEEALRCLVAPEPFANDTEAEIEALQADVLKDHPWEA